MSDFEDYKKYLRSKRKKQAKRVNYQQPTQNLYSNNQGSSMLPSFNNQQPKNYNQLLAQEKAKQKYKDYMKQKRTQQINNVINNTRRITNTTKQASSNFLSKAKSLLNKPKKVGYEKQF